MRSKIVKVLSNIVMIFGCFLLLGVIFGDLADDQERIALGTLAVLLCAAPKVFVIRWGLIALGASITAFGTILSIAYSEEPTSITQLLALAMCIAIDGYAAYRLYRWATKDVRQPARSRIKIIQRTAIDQVNEIAKRAIARHERTRSQISAKDAAEKGPLRTVEQTPVFVPSESLLKQQQKKPPVDLNRVSEITTDLAIVQKHITELPTDTNLCEAQPDPTPKVRSCSAEHPVLEEPEIGTDELTTTPAIPDNVQSAGTETADAAILDISFIDQETVIFDCVCDPANRAQITDLVASSDLDEAQPTPTPGIQPIHTEQPVLEDPKAKTDEPTGNPTIPDNVQSAGTAITDAATEDNSSNDQETDVLDRIRDPQVMVHYIVLDIETTGFSPDNDRIIEIAAIHYVFGEEAKRFHTYVNPQIPVPKHITKLTGIRQIDVDNAPLLEDIADDFREFINGYPLVGHNIINFDLPFLASHMDLNEIPLVIDTLDMSRLVFPMLPSHKLSNLNFWFDLNKGASHRADADATATNALLWACLYPDRYASLYKKAVRNGLPEINHTYEVKPKHHYGRVSVSEVKPSSGQSVKSGPLCGKKIAFTGELSISRKDAMQIAVDAGAILRSNVSSKTDILVVGRQDLSVVGSDGMSLKQEKAQEINESGKGCIKVIDENEFMAMIAANPG